MRQTVIVATAALIAAVVAIWSATAIPGNSPRQATATSVSTSIDVMEMMKNAKNLPEQRFDAH